MKFPSIPSSRIKHFQQTVLKHRECMFLLHVEK